MIPTLARTPLLAVLVSVIGCTPATQAGAPAEPASINGQITAVTRAGEKIGSIRVEEKPAETAGSAKAVARIGQGTTVLATGGGAADFNSLKVGQWVRVWFTGPVAESYPVQATASAVVIDSLPR